MSNFVELKDLEPGFYDLEEYQGSNKQPARFFVRIEAVENTQLTLTELNSGKQHVLQYHPYMSISPVDRQTVVYRRIGLERELEAAQQRAREIRAALAQIAKL
jgi:hypothetical protein